MSNYGVRLLVGPGDVPRIAWGGLVNEILPLLINLIRFAPDPGEEARQRLEDQPDRWLLIRDRFDRGDLKTLRDALRVGVATHLELPPDRTVVYGPTDLVAGEGLAGTEGVAITTYSVTRAQSVALPESLFAPSTGLDTASDWRAAARSVLKDLSTDAFASLCQRVLIASGLEDVKVLRSTEDGFHARGTARLARVLGTSVVIQAQHSGSDVEASAVGELRSRMAGPWEKGLFITSRRFTAAAREEARDEGTPPIDLIDEERLVTLLKQLQLGVRVVERVAEDVEVDPVFFSTL